MPRGPAPNPNRRRTNEPTIPTTNLPASGRKGPPPELPELVELERAGTAWWQWAWATPHAAAWSDGDLYVIARRASLEDDLATIADVENLDALMLTDADGDLVSIRVLRAIVSRLAALCSGRLAIMKEMRELDSRLGLTPKAMLDLRWEIVDDSHAEDAGTGESERDYSRMTVKQLRALVPGSKAGTRKADLIAALESPEVVQIDDRRRRLTANAP